MEWRVNMNKMKQDMSFNNIFRALFPAILYMLISSMVEVTVCLYIFLSGSYGDVETTNGLDFFYMFSENINDMAVHYGYLITFFSALISAVIFFLIFMKECNKNREYLKAYLSNRVKGLDLIKIFLLGASAGPGLSRLLTLIRIKKILEDYERVSKNLLNGPLIIQIISIALIVPVTEELIYRGVIYLRLRKMTTMRQAAFVTSMIFGLFHFNLLQAMYAFLLSFILLFVFEKYKSITVCIVLHGTANLIAVISEYYGIFNFINKNIMIYLAVMIVELLTATLLMDRMYYEEHTKKWS